MMEAPSKPSKPEALPPLPSLQFSTQSGGSLRRRLGRLVRKRALAPALSSSDRIAQSALQCTARVATGRLASYASTERLVERLLADVGPHALERAVEASAERSVAHTLERAAEATAARRALEAAVAELAEKSAERYLERSISQLAETASNKMLARALSSGTLAALGHVAEAASDKALVTAVGRGGGALEGYLAKVAEQASERCFQKAVARLAADGAGRRAAAELAAHSAEHSAALVSLVLERGGHVGAELASERVVERGTQSGFRLLDGRGVLGPLSRRQAAAALWFVKVLVPVVGTALVVHLLHHDWHRMQSERAKKQSGKCASLARLLFLFAALCDVVDVGVHCLVVAHHFTHVDHGIMVPAERLGLVAAVGAIAALLLGEIASAAAATAAGRQSDAGHERHDAPDQGDKKKIE
ncbi:hypothetical protein M885DRAFT_587517 [Pelagophyceae sp. CCMP2097]|nr:hypothetical protein M885DRAFT_587517 [Pelagophyceae sp. CCMP2097]|mmetsp:Transcript_29286/g.98696  ORF Transcript_29286/g.98696 Transcript_29286/m.98696 type:complete len:416 (-) Transcript_29286:59-1306(-)